MHYAYYKNSATHNTITVNQTNQPPAVPMVHHYYESDAFCWLDTGVDWRQIPPVLDSHTRVQWDSEAWRDVRFRRRLLWLDNAIIDISNVQNPHSQQIDWTLHLQGKALDSEGECAQFSSQGPLVIMKDARCVQLTNSQPRHFATPHNGQALWLYGHAELWQGNAPDNPAVQDLSYLVLRNKEQSSQFICVWDFDHQQPITDMHVTPDSNGMTIQLRRGERTVLVDLCEEYAVLPQLKTSHIPF